MAGILILEPFLGLMPFRAARSETRKLPNPVRVTVFPLESSEVMQSRTASSAMEAAFLVIPEASEATRIKSALVMEGRG